jgi:hypothetical protein
MNAIKVGSVSDPGDSQRQAGHSKCEGAHHRLHWFGSNINSLAGIPFLDREAAKMLRRPQGDRHCGGIGRTAASAGLSDAEAALS